MLPLQKVPSVCDCVEVRGKEKNFVCVAIARGELSASNRVMATAKKTRAKKTASKKAAAKKTASKKAAAKKTAAKKTAAKKTASKKTAPKKAAPKAAKAKKESLIQQKRSTGDGPACWPGFERVPGKEAGTKGSCKAKPHQTKGEKKEDGREAAGAKLSKAGGNKAKANRS